MEEPKIGISGTGLKTPQGLSKKKPILQKFQGRIILEEDGWKLCQAHFCT